MKKKFTQAAQDAKVDHFLMSVDALTNITEMLAEQTVLKSEYKIMPHGSRLITVQPGWEMDYLVKNNPDAVKDTLRGLEAALQNPDIKTIFMTRAALMTENDIVRVCQRNPTPKTLVREGGI